MTVRTSAAGTLVEYAGATSRASAAGMMIEYALARVAVAAVGLMVEHDATLAPASARRPPPQVIS